MILAIDPGTTESAWVLWDGARVEDHAKEDNVRVISRMSSLSSWLGVNMLAVEMIASYGMPVGKEVFETCVWIGRFVEAWSSRGRNFRMVYRKDVKLELCGNPRAKDTNIRQALIDRVGPQGKKAAPGPTYGLAGDEWAALGVAVTASARTEVLC